MLVRAGQAAASLSASAAPQRNQLIIQNINGTIPNKGATTQAIQVVTEPMLSHRIKCDRVIATPHFAADILLEEVSVFQRFHCFLKII